MDDASLCSLNSGQACLCHRLPRNSSVCETGIHSHNLNCCLACNLTKDQLSNGLQSNSSSTALLGLPLLQF